jgi:hypothetical protein
MPAGEPAIAAAAKRMKERRFIFQRVIAQCHQKVYLGSHAATRAALCWRLHGIGNLRSNRQAQSL